MGCSSWKCQECGRGVKSSSFSGEQVHLFLLKEGKIIQQMTGEYNSYGSVFIDNTQHPGVKHELRDSRDWNDPDPDSDLKSKDHERDVWHRVCDLMFSDDITNGIAAIHVACFKKSPTVRSVDDPNQGWGDDDEESYFGTTQGEGHEYYPPKPIPGYDVIKDHRKTYLRKRIWELGNSFADDMDFVTLVTSGKKDSEAESRFEKRLKERKQQVAEMERELKELDRLW
jgi:hypothetical protein